VILVSTVVFGLASVGCALSDSLSEVLFFRALQGMSAGAGQIVGRAIIRDCLEGHAAHRMMAMVSMVFSLAPALAPIIGGWIIAFAEWPAIFWFLAGFSLLLFLAVWLLLPETHPEPLRVRFRPTDLMRGNLAMLRNRQFIRLSLAAGFNFSAIFVYIASAPAFVLQILKLNAQQFGWFFVPMIAGMSAGAFVSSRLAGRISGHRAVNLGFLVCGLAAVVNVASNVLFEPVSPWAVLPISLNAFGVALVFPILMLAILDMYPRQRGTASSMQMVVGLSVIATVAGVVSPWASQSALRLALCAALLTAIAWLIWHAYVRRSPDPPAPQHAEEVAGLEPVDRL